MQPQSDARPEVDASLVAHLDRTHAAQCGSGDAPNHGIFGFPREIVAREINQVIILYAGATGATGEDVPDPSGRGIRQPAAIGAAGSPAAAPAGPSDRDQNE